MFWCPKYKSQSRCSLWRKKFFRSFQSRQMTNSFSPECITVALRLRIWHNFGQFCEYYVSNELHIFVLVTMKVLFAVKIRRVRQVLAQTEVKILISAYNDHQEILNNFKSSKGKNPVEDIWHPYWTLQNAWHWKFHNFNTNKGEVANTIRKIPRRQVTAENLSNFLCALTKFAQNLSIKPNYWR